MHSHSIEVLIRLERFDSCPSLDKVPDTSVQLPQSNGCAAQFMRLFHCTSDHLRKSTRPGGQNPANHPSFNVRTRQTQTPPRGGSISA